MLILANVFLKNGEDGFFPKINKRGDCNKRGGKNILEKLINGEALIRVSRVEIFSEINSRACPAIK